MKRGAIVEEEIVDAGRRDPGRHSRFGKEMRRLSERAVASAKKRLSLAEINREVARRRGSRA